ncbi:MAG: hypothetical protein Q4C47_05370, partial [Planctomycetia bacterium]|nr:hypothetical protein [Planctomycetia bacterium]
KRRPPRRWRLVPVSGGSGTIVWGRNGSRPDEPSHRCRDASWETWWKGGRSDDARWNHATRFGSAMGDGVV